MSPRSKFVTLMLTSLAAGSCIMLGVVTGATDGLDKALFETAHGFDNGSPQYVAAWVREAIRDVTALGSTIVLAGAVLSTAAYLIALRHRRLAIVLATSATLATLLSTLLKLAMDRVRPSLVEHAVVTYTASFPSGHAMLTAAIVLPLVGLLARTVMVPSARRVIVIAGVILTLMVGISRVYLGVHWPTDVVAGWCFGTFWACATLLIAYQPQPLPEDRRSNTYSSGRLRNSDS